MSSTTFGYDTSEDRIWMSFDDGSPRLWLTRRLVSHLLSPMLGAFESAAPGGEGGAPASVRVALEHELAMNELLPGEQSLPIRMGVASSAESQGIEHVLCVGLAATFDAGACSLRFNTADGERVLQMSRVAMHRWLRGLHLVMRHAEWGLPAPPWLARSCLPDALRSRILGGAPLPPEPAQGE